MGRRGMPCPDSRKPLPRKPESDVSSPLAASRTSTGGGMSLRAQLCIGTQRTFTLHLLKSDAGTSLVVQWLRTLLPMQGTWDQALVWEDPTCRGATKLMCHNY